MSNTNETRFPQHDEFLFSSPTVVLEKKSGYCNAVTVARVLPLVHASAENGKDPLHERRRWLHQCDILRNIVPVRKPVGICLCFGGLFENEAHLGHIFTSSRPWTSVFHFSLFLYDVWP